MKLLGFGPEKADNYDDRKKRLIAPNSPTYASKLAEKASLECQALKFKQKRKSISTTKKKPENNTE